MERLSGRVALVTGAASGIGRAIARRLGDEGAIVMVTDINDSGGQLVADELASGTTKAAYRHLDVASEAEWASVIHQTVSEFGGLDILVNNAGVVPEPVALEDTTLAEWERTIAILQTGVFLGMKCAAPALRRSAHASVINISSVFGASGGLGITPSYHAAKGAIRIMTKSAALHWATEGIRANSVHPGFIDTPMLHPDDAPPELLAALPEIILGLTPMGRLGRPEEVAAGVAFLASDDAGFVTGSELYIDGGYMAR
jgi:NAD(P)-dependent dehydrogenase (short-subunit alcohol dehydrogenase family)